MTSQSIPSPASRPVAVRRSPASAVSYRAIEMDRYVRRGRDPRLERLAAALPPVAILVAQAVLSIRLVWSNTAFQDEGLYLWAGHLEWAHWLHGTPIPAFPTYFSGSPVLYPPIGALADSVGGLAGARILSLCFMLGTTALLWSVITQLYGRRAAFFGAGLFAVAGPTLRLGAFATYDAMALLLLAAAMWCALQTGAKHSMRTSSAWLVAAAGALALSNATKYATALFDPVVIGLVVITGCRRLPWRKSVAQGATMTAYAAGILLFLLFFGGSEYVQGVSQTTISRVSGGSPTGVVLGQSWHLVAFVGIIALVGATIGLLGRSPLPDRLLLVVVALSVVLVPLQQARIHTTTSLNKHVDFGLLFASVAAGFGIDWVLRLVRSRRTGVAVTVACVAALAVPTELGASQAKTLFQTWPNSTRLVATLTPLVEHAPGPILAEHPALLQYYLPAGYNWQRWSSTFTVRLADGHSVSAGVGTQVNAAIYLNLIREHFFSVIELDFGPSASLDTKLVPVLRQTEAPYYRLVATVQYGPRGAEIWVLRGPHTRPSSRVLPAAGIPVFEELLLPAVRTHAILQLVATVVEIAGAVTLAFTLAVRYGWRRNKASADL